MRKPPPIVVIHKRVDRYLKVGQRVRVVRTTQEQVVVSTPDGLGFLDRVSGRGTRAPGRPGLGEQRADLTGWQLRLQDLNAYYSPEAEERRSHMQ